MTFDHFARWIEHQVGTPIAFGIAVGIVAVWAITGPLFAWSDTWQLVINTGTTIVTFLMVFLIQSTQSRDTAAINLKLDELIRVSAAARNQLIAAEDMEQAHLDALRHDLQREAEP